MAEILGLFASVIALIQLADGLTETIPKYVNTVRGTKAELVPLLDRLRNLLSILDTLRPQLEASPTKSIALQYLEDPVRVVESILRTVQLRLDNMKIVAGCVFGPVLDKQTTNQLKSLDQLIPILQLALDAEKLASIRAIESYVQSLQLDSVEQAHNIRRDNQAYYENTVQRRNAEERLREASTESRLRERVLTWLHIVDPILNYHAACQLQQPGTGQWLLESPDFADWENGNESELWLNATAGAGKTVLSSTIITHLISKYDESSIAYYFFDFREAAKQEVLSLMASLVLQASCTLKPLPEILKSLFQRHSVRSPERPSTPTITELTEVLTAVICLHARFYIVIDALDECRQRPLLLETIRSLSRQTKLRLLLTSRAEQDIQQAFQTTAIRSLRIQNHHVDHDVAFHVRAVLENDTRLKSHRQDIKNLITKALTEGSKGMFRWVQCQIDHIKTLRTARDVKLALGQLPPDLDRTYDRILLSVPAIDCQYLYRALRLLVFSCRPLTLAEVAEAVVIEPGAQEIDEDARLPTPHDLLDIGGSLFAPVTTADPREQHLDLAHYSVKEYLLSVRAANGPGAAFALDETQAQIENTTSCLTYLGLDVFKDEWRQLDSRTWDQEMGNGSNEIEEHLIQRHEQRLGDYPFLEYAARYCFRHCKEQVVQHAVASRIRTTLSTESSGSFRTMTYTCTFTLGTASNSSYERVFRYSLISIAAHYGLLVVVQNLLDNGIPADYITPRPHWIEQYPEGQTALCRAADFGFDRICKILINAGASVHGATCTDCPLSAAARSGDPSIVQMMLDGGADVERDATPLAKTQLSIWWKFTEGATSFGDVLEILRKVGAKWSTVGLLVAFSKAAELLVKHINTVSGQGSTLEFPEDDSFDCVVAAMDTNMLDALQWLAQDEDGVTGLKASIAALLRGMYKSGPCLFAADPTRLTGQKSRPEEVVAENLIDFYFRLACPSPATVSGRNSIYEILDARWESVSSTASCTGGSAEGPRQESHLGVWKPERLVICGKILRAWNRARWDYADFLDS